MLVAFAGGSCSRVTCLPYLPPQPNTQPQPTQLSLFNNTLTSPSTTTHSLALFIPFSIFRPSSDTITIHFSYCFDATTSQPNDRTNRNGITGSYPSLPCRFDSKPSFPDRHPLSFGCSCRPYNLYVTQYLSRISTLLGQRSLLPDRPAWVVSI